eukprot:1860323-Amphidinium_carterae.2
MRLRSMTLASFPGITSDAVTKWSGHLLHPTIWFLHANWRSGPCCWIETHHTLTFWIRSRIGRHELCLVTCVHVAIEALP